MLCCDLCGVKAESNGSKVRSFGIAMGRSVQEEGSIPTVGLPYAFDRHLDLCDPCRQRVVAVVERAVDGLLAPPDAVMDTTTLGRAVKGFIGQGKVVALPPGEIKPRCKKIGMAEGQDKLSVRCGFPEGHDGECCFNPLSAFSLKVNRTVSEMAETRIKEIEKAIYEQFAKGAMPSPLKPLCIATDHTNFHYCGFEAGHDGPHSYEIATKEPKPVIHYLDPFLQDHIWCKAKVVDDSHTTDMDKVTCSECLRLLQSTSVTVGEVLTRVDTWSKGFNVVIERTEIPAVIKTPLIQEDDPCCSYVIQEDATGPGGVTGVKYKRCIHKRGHDGDHEYRD